MPEIAEVSPQPKVEQPEVKVEQTPPPPNKIKEGILRLVDKIKGRINGPASDPDDALKDIVNFSGETTEVSNHEKTSPIKTDMDTEEIKVDRDIQNAQEKTVDEDPTYEELLQISERDWLKAERLMTEASERRLKENEVKFKIDAIHSNMHYLDKGKLSEESKSYTENKIKEDLNWFAENPNRAQETINYIHSQEKILVDARSLPNITETEKEYIDMMENNLSKIRTELSNRGVSIPDKENNTGHTVYGLEYNPPISVDPETAFEYAYHATPLHNIRAIAENGLQPSPIWSKEPGAIFFNAYDHASDYKPSLGVVFRTLVEKLPDVHGHKLDFFINGKYIYPGGSGPTAVDSAISIANLEFSLDAGQTWRKSMEVFRNTSDNISANSEAAKAA